MKAIFMTDNNTGITSINIVDINSDLPLTDKNVTIQVTDVGLIPELADMEVSLYSKHFNIQEIFASYDNIDPKCIDILASEAADCEEYCNYILDCVENLAKNPETVEIAKRISESILKNTIDIIEDHIKMVEKNYYNYYHKQKKD